jgi:hypothetical protein
MDAPTPLTFIPVTPYFNQGYRISLKYMPIKYERCWSIIEGVLAKGVNILCLA